MKVEKKSDIKKISKYSKRSFAMPYAFVVEVNPERP